MTLGDYVLTALGIACPVSAAAGYDMLEKAKARAIAWFWVAAISFGSLGIVWGVWGADSSQPLWIRLAVAGVTGAVAAIALTWVLWQVRDHVAASQAKNQGSGTMEQGPGGSGGKAKVTGDRSGAEGGTGGKGGLGSGGPGGDAEVVGDDSFARGGDGGNAAQPDGRGGPRTASPGERLNLPTSMWPYGYSGRGANNPEYDRRLRILTQIRAQFMQAFPDDVTFIEAGVDQVPISWVNKRLEEMGETWRVEMENGGYKLPPLNAR